MNNFFVILCQSTIIGLLDHLAGQDRTRSWRQLTDPNEYETRCLSKKTLACDKRKPLVRSHRLGESCDDGEIREHDMVDAINGGVESTKCLLCGGLRHRPIFNEFGIDILQCRQCHHVFSSFEANPHYDGFWGEEVGEGDHFYWSKARSRMHQDFFKRFLIGRSGRLLDMGCGLGFFLKAMAPYENWEAYGCEISPAAVRYARETLGVSNIICSRLDAADFPHNSFDLITLWDVIDHILRPDPLLRRCHELLREGGICFIRTPNVCMQLPRARLIKLLRGMKPGVAYLQAQDHLHHYSMSSIRRLLERNGLSGVELVHLHPIQSDSRNRGRIVGGLKNMWFEVAYALATASRGHLNFDNLFVVAQKETQTQQ